MVELGKPIHTFDAAAVHDARIVVRLATAGERLETLDHVVRDLHPETLADRRSGRSARDRGRHGRGHVRGGPGHDGGRHRVGHLRSGQHPPDGVPLRPAVRGEPALREGDRVETRPARGGPHGPSHRRMGRRDDRAGRGRFESGGSAAGHRLVPAVPRQPPARDDVRDRRAARPAGPGRDRDGPSGAGARVVVAAGPRPLEVDPGSDEVIDATIPTWRRDLAIEADITEEVIRVRGYELVPPRLPHTPMPPYRHDPLELRHAVRETLAGAGVTEVVTSALVSPRAVERFPARDDGAIDGESEQRAIGRAVAVTNPLSSQHSVLRQSVLGSLLEVVSTNLRYGREDVAIFEIGKGYGATDDGTTHEWWRLGVRADRPGRAAGLEPAGAAVRPRRRQGPRRADLPSPGVRGADLRAAHRRPQPAPRPCGPRRRGRRPGRPGRRAASGDRRGARAPRRAGPGGRARDPGPRRWRARRVRTAAPSRHPSVQRDLAIVVPRRRVRRARRGRDPPPWRAAPAGRDAVRHLSRPTARADREEPRVPPDVARRRAHAHGGGGRFGRRRGRRRARGRHRGPRPDLTGVHRTAPDHRNPDRTIAGCADGLATCESRC